MKYNWLSCIFLVMLQQGEVSCTDPLAPALPKEASPSKNSASPPHNSPDQRTSSPLQLNSRPVLTKWYAQTSHPQTGESFGELVARSGTAQLGTPYYNHPQTTEPEQFSIALDTFQCVSFVESTMALSRCIWKNENNEDCFIKEVKESRYRDGEVDGYASRLHYFFDWLSNNSERGRLTPLTRAFGGRKFKRRRQKKLFSIMTSRPKRYPALLNPSVFHDIQSIENSLNSQHPYVLRRKQLTGLNDRLENGDVVAVVTNTRGILISHTGFILKNSDGKARFLHASSYHERVVVSENDIADYISRDKSRLGILIYRPTHPES